MDCFTHQHSSPRPICVEENAEERVRRRRRLRYIGYFVVALYVVAGIAMWIHGWPAFHD